MDAGRGLAAAHEKGIIHRDFKTDNVMISRDRHVRVMDFGLARQVQDRPVPAPASGPPAVAIVVPSVVLQPIPIRTTDSGRPLAKDGPPTMVISVEPAAPSAGPIPIEGRLSSGSFDARLTRTGAMMGTPAYMAPEQFLGTPTDARSDQFSFCISLYEALYKERPFEGTTMSTLTANVVHGNVRPAPSGSKVPPWLRRVLLRGLQARAKDRYASMEALIEALGSDPNVQRKKVAAAVAGIAVMGALGFGGWRLLADKSQVCSGGPAKLAGIWDLQKAGEPEPARHAQIRQAFIGTGKSYAPDVFATVSHALTTYAQNWANMYKDACEATQVRREQSVEVMDLRMECLQERLGGVQALTDVFGAADGEVVEKSVGAVSSLELLDRCANVPLLRAVVKPPEDPPTRQRVAELRQRLVSLKARFDAGQWKKTGAEGPALIADVRKIGYKPLLAEALAQEGVMLVRANESSAGAQVLTEAYSVADASRHDEIRAETAAFLVHVVGYLEMRFPEAQSWATTANSVLERLGGHELVRAWLLNDLGNVLLVQGDTRGAVLMQQEGLALKEKVLGRDHPDVGFSEGNLSNALQSLGRNEEALVHVDRAISLLEKGLGSGHPELASQLNNRGEVLNALGRPREARRSFERACAIWERELGPESRLLAYGLTGIGQTYLAEENAAGALVPLNRAMRIRESLETDQAKRAETAFALARALWDANRDRVRAQLLAEQARESYAKAGAKNVPASVTAWLKAHSRG
jgi:tetratricopeptide (TPR) repeat protein